MFIYDYYDYAHNETRHNVIQLEEKFLENGNMVDYLYKDQWLRAKQISNDLTDMFLLRQNADDVYFYANDFALYGPYEGKS